MLFLFFREVLHLESWKIIAFSATTASTGKSITRVQCQLLLRSALLFLLLCVVFPPFSLIEKKCACCWLAITAVLSQMRRGASADDSAKKLVAQRAKPQHSRSDQTWFCVFRGVCAITRSICVVRCFRCSLSPVFHRDLSCHAPCRAALSVRVLSLFARRYEAPTYAAEGASRPGVRDHR